jgi:ribose 5-phosphate isomerase B
MLYIGADHAGFHLKERIKEYLVSAGISFNDLGNLVYDSADDYPDFAFKVAKKVGLKKDARGILFCGSAFGVAIAANKVKGIRAVPVHSVREAEFSRLHNDANILCLSGWHLSFGIAKKIVSAWLKAKFSRASRHVRRLKKIEMIERGKWR